MRLGKRQLLAAMGVVCVGAATFVHAQEVLGGITGTVTDRAQAAITSAQLKITNISTGLSRTTAAQGNGSFAFPDLPSGTYEVSVSKDGFETQNYPAIVVQGNRVVTLQVQLAAGNITQSVTVEGSPLLNAVDTTNGYVLSHAQIQEIPLATGSFTQLAILSPGVNAEFINGTGTNEGLGNQPIWANGQRDTDNTFQVNGVDVSNLFNGKSTSQVASGRVTPNTGENFTSGGTIQTNTSVYDAIGNAIPSPSPETIQELRVNTSLYDAQQGQTSGAHVDVNTVSGTNAYHGQAYVYRQTNFLNAAPFFYKQQSTDFPNGTIPPDQVNPYLHRVVAGGTVGGPIIKDKLFGFLGYNGIRVTDQLNGTSRLFLPYGLTDDRSPSGIAAAVASTGQSFSGTINPAALALLQYKLPNGQYLIPSAGANGQADLLANQPNATLFGVPSFKADQANANLDYNIRNSDVLSLKYFFQHDPAENPFTDSNVSGFNQHLDAGSHLASISNTYTPSSHFSWQQSFGFVREKAYSTNDQALTPQAVGINLFGFTTFPGISISNVNGITSNSLNIGPTGSFFRDGVFQTRFAPSTTVIQTFGAHTLTYGASYAYTQLNIRNRRQNTGIIGFQNFADFVQGTVRGNTSTFLQGASSRYYRATYIGGFVQDKWRVNRNLSITAGFRYDYDGPLSEKYGNLFGFDSSRYSYDFGSDTITDDGFIIAGNNKQYHTPGVSDSTLLNLQEGFSPRIGFAWSPRKDNGNVVIRGGFGLYYNRGEYFTYFSPGAGSGVSGPFGVTQEPPFVIPTPAPAGATLDNPFGTTLPNPPTGNPQGFYAYLPNRAGIEQGAQTFPFGSYDIHNKLPYSENYSLDFQWQASSTTAVDIGFVGNRGRRGVIPVPFNQPGIATPSNPINGETYSYGYQATDAGGNALTTEPQNTYDGGNTDLRVPFIGYGINSVSYRAAGSSAYDALQTQVQKRLSHGVQFGISYTWSHSLDEQSGLGLFYNGSNPLNLRSGYGNSDFDRTNVTSFNYVWQIPDFIHSHSVLAKVVNGFALQGISVFQSGQAYSVEDYSGAVASQYYSFNDGITNPIIPLAPGVRPSQALTGHSGAFQDSGGNAIPALNASAFIIPFVNPGQNGVPSCGLSTAGNPVCDVFETTFGQPGQRNIFRQSFQKRADVSVVKAFQVEDRIALQYRLDLYNVSNTPSFDIPNNSISTAFNANFQNVYDPTLSTIQNRQTVYNIQNNGANVSAASGLGVVQQAIGSPRLIQMSLRLNF
jgi:hypothetical protein